MVSIRSSNDLQNFIKTIRGLEASTDEPTVIPIATDRIPLSNLYDTTNEGPTVLSSNKNKAPLIKLHSSAEGTFRALRMIVNDELNELDCAIKSAHYFLKDEAPLATVSYNSLEDTIIKRHFRGLNIDASPDSIGKPQHRDMKNTGLVQHEDCVPWGKMNKIKTDWGQVVPYSHWKNAIFRTAIKNNNVLYDS